MDDSQEYHGFPYYIYTPGGGGLRYFMVRLDTDELVKAYVDPGNVIHQTWRRADTSEEIHSYRVRGFRVIDGEPAFPTKGQ